MAIAAESDQNLIEFSGPKIVMPKAAKPVGLLNESRKIDVVLSLELRNKAELEAVTAAIYDRNSAHFQQYTQRQ